MQWTSDSNIEKIKIEKPGKGARKRVSRELTSGII